MMLISAQNNTLPVKRCVRLYGVYGLSLKQAVARAVCYYWNGRRLLNVCCRSLGVQLYFCVRFLLYA